MASTNNLGRIQGGGFFGSTSTSTTSITKTTVQTNGVSPLVGDTIVNANGDLCRITAITSSAYTVTKYGSIKGATGATGSPGKSGVYTENITRTILVFRFLKPTYAFDLERPDGSSSTGSILSGEVSFDTFTSDFTNETSVTDWVTLYKWLYQSLWVNPNAANKTGFYNVPCSGWIQIIDNDKGPQLWYVNSIAIQYPEKPSGGTPSSISFRGVPQPLNQGEIAVPIGVGGTILVNGSDMDMGGNSVTITSLNPHVPVVRNPIV